MNESKNTMLSKKKKLDITCLQNIGNLIHQLLGREDSSMSEAAIYQMGTCPKVP